MKKFSRVLLLLAIICSVPAQTVTSQNKKGLPAFDIIQADGSHLKLADLKKDLPVMFVYFDPDCDHCEIFIQELLKQISAFNNIQIVMITYVPIRALKDFISKHALGKYPGLRIGTEGSNYIVRYHYNVMQFPYLALHDKTGNLFATYESEVPTPLQLAVMFK